MKEAKLQNIEKCSEPSLIQFRVIIWAPTITEGRGPPLEPFTLHASVRFRTRVQLPIRNGDFHETSGHLVILREVTNRNIAFILWYQLHEVFFGD